MAAAARHRRAASRRELRRRAAADTAARVVAVADSNVLWQEPAEVAEHVEPHLVDAIAQHAHATLDQVLEASVADDPAALAADAVLHVLVERRVEHLTIDPAAAFRLSSRRRPAAGRRGWRRPLRRARDRSGGRRRRQGHDARCRRRADLHDADGIAAVLRY